MVFMCFTSPSGAADVSPVRGLRNVNHANVRLQGGFWGVRQETQALSDGKEVTITAVPYYAWANREKGAVIVYCRRAG